MKRIHSRKGIALVTVMMVSIILLALAGAFFAAHRTDLQLMGTSVKLEKTKNAALSAAEFFQYKLQNERKFGAEPFISGVVEQFPDDGLDPMMTVEYESDGSDFRTNVVKGTILKTGLTFEGRILNNLDNNSKGEHDLGETPPRSVRVWITTKQGFIVKHMDFILKRSPFSSVSMLSGNDIEVDLASSEDGHWWLGARQPSGNAVRANGRIKGPEVLSKTGRAVLFEAPDGLTQLDPPYGVIQAQELEMKMDGLSTSIEAGNDKLVDIEKNIEGVLSPGGAGVEVPTLDADTLASPMNSFDLPTDKVIFRSREENGVAVHELLEGNSVVHTFNGTGTRTFEWSSGSTYSDKQIAARFDLEKRTMTVSGSFELKSDNSFTLAAEDGNQPTLILGNDDPNAVATINANGIDIQGSVGGRGALKANKADLNIRAKSSLSTTPDFGVALHSDENVNLSKPGSSSNDGIPSDWDAFNQAFHQDPDPAIDNWLTWSGNKNEKAGDFSRVVLSPAGTEPGDDPIWISLTEEFEADEKAMEAYREWTKEEVPEEVGPDPDWEPGEPPMVDDPDWDPGEPPMIDDPDWDPGRPRMIRNPDPEGRPRYIRDPDWDPGEPDQIPDPDWDPGEPAQISDPDWEPGDPPQIVLDPGEDAGPGLTMENYIRMREYLKTKEELGKGDESWLDPGQSSRRNDAKTLIKNQLTSYHLKAGQYSVQEDGQVRLEWNPLSSYLTGSQGSNPFLTGYSADMSFRGLIYAGKNFRFDTQQQGMEIEGALVAHGDIDIINATGARIIYNSELLENLFVVNDGDNSANLERAYWAYY